MPLPHNLRPCCHALLLPNSSFALFPTLMALSFLCCRGHASPPQPVHVLPCLCSTPTACTFAAVPAPRSHGLHTCCRAWAPLPRPVHLLPCLRLAPTACTLAAMPVPHSHGLYPAAVPTHRPAERACTLRLPQHQHRRSRPCGPGLWANRKVDELVSGKQPALGGVQGGGVNQLV